MKRRLYNILAWLMLGIVFVVVYGIYLGGTVSGIINDFKSKPVETCILLAIIIAIVALISIAINKYISRPFKKD